MMMLHKMFDNLIVQWHPHSLASELNHTEDDWLKKSIKLKKEAKDKDGCARIIYYFTKNQKVEFLISRSFLEGKLDNLSSKPGMKNWLNIR
mgnify:CR=1 FL=1